MKSALEQKRDQSLKKTVPHFVAQECMYLSNDVYQSIEIKAIQEKCEENGVPEFDFYPVMVIERIFKFANF